MLYESFLRRPPLISLFLLTFLPQYVSQSLCEVNFLEDQLGQLQRFFVPVYVVNVSFLVGFQCFIFVSINP